MAIRCHAERDRALQQSRPEGDEIGKERPIDQLADAGTRGRRGDQIRPCRERRHGVRHGHRKAGSREEGVIVLGVAHPHGVVQREPETLEGRPQAALLRDAAR